MRRFAPILAIVLGTARAGAETPDADAAKRAFEDGASLESKHEYAAALEKFRESERSKRTLSNRFHQAYCLEMLGKLASALSEYESIEAEARTANRSDIATSTSTRLDGLRPRVPRLALRASAALPSDAEVAVDGAPVAPGAIDGPALRLDPGDHVVTARAPNHAPFERSLMVAAGDSATVDIVLRRSVEIAPAAATHVTAPAERGRDGSPALPLATTIASGVFVAGGIATFLAAGSAQSDAEAACRRAPSCDDERSTVRALDAIALGAFIGAAGAAALSVVLWTRRPARVAASGATLAIEGRF